MKTVSVMSLAVVVAMAGCVSIGPSWQATRQKNTIEGYLAFNKACPDSPHLDESKREIKALTSGYLSSIKDVTVVLDSTKSAPSGCDINAVLTTVTTALNRKGYRTTSPATPNRLVVSISQECVFSGTSHSYWHPTIATEVQLAFEHPQYGRLFTQTYRVSASDRKRTVKFSDIGVIPIDASEPTYINPEKGTARGKGVEMTMGTRDADATTSAKEIREYPWSSLISQKTLLADLEQQFEHEPPLGLRDSTEWAW
ncbi:MAG: hypothetical protein NTZ78_00955 [Candidatus Aureabacteria bacterium]|nr:hypothetical protein [Candidatus Auribacterota bacterium]